MNAEISFILENATIVEAPTHITDANIGNLYFKIKADAGSKFLNGVTFFGWTMYSSPVQLNFEISEDDTVAILSGDFSQYQNGHSFNVTAKAEIVENPFRGYGAINVYVVDEDDLDAFAGVRYIIPNLEGAELIDMGGYVHNIFRVYAQIDDLKPAKLRAGNYNTQIDVFTPSQNVLEVDCGTITLPLYNGSNLDYQATIQAFLPFAGFVNIDTAYLGETISVKYKIDLPTGDGVAIVEHDGVGVQFIECRPTTDIIYNVNKSDMDVIGGSNWAVGYLSGLEPYVIVKWFEATSENILNSDSRRLKLSYVQGYAEIDEVVGLNNVRISERDKSDIINILKSGIYVS